MMDMKINGGSLKITDDNRIVTSKNIADEIRNKCISPDGFKDENYKPDLEVSD